jgi:hypothetical protein
MGASGARQRLPFRGTLEPVSIVTFTKGCRSPAAYDGGVPPPALRTQYPVPVR